MKRLSYVVECAARPQTPATTHSLGLGSKHAKQPMASLRAPATPHPVKKGPSYVENRPPKNREGPRPHPHTAQRGRSLTKFELAQTRRKMLEEWRAKNGKTLKRPPLFLKPANRNEKPARASETKTHYWRIWRRRWRREGGSSGVETRGKDRERYLEGEASAGDCRGLCSRYGGGRGRKRGRGGGGASHPHKRERR
ncbi:hypothetical protein GBAR_LOCUS20760 [Geodia barretti]|nr:hypothetical protein GBAR_LOCUS20760 [Geodia barretti]